MNIDELNIVPEMLDNLFAKINPFVDQIIAKKEVNREAFMRTVDQYLYEISGDDGIIEKYSTVEKKNLRLKAFCLFVDEVETNHNKFINKKKNKELDQKGLLMCYLAGLIITYLQKQYPEKLCAI
jgi:hypothetical protein